LLDFLYSRVVERRRRWFERHPDARRRLREPVVSVGNLSVGGTGKTPMVSRIARWLLDQGERPAILSRGYGRHDRRDGVVVVSDGQRVLAHVDQSGDEPLMLARSMPAAVVVVGEDRFLAGALAERRLGATVHLLDDGFQHVQLERDLDILMTSPGEITGGRVLPRGRLREPIAAAARAHVVVVLESDLASARSEAWTLGVSQVVAGRRTLQRAEGAEGAGGASSAGANGAVGADGASGAVVAVAGTARPEEFFAMLRASGYRVADALRFADHHRFSRADVARIHAAVQTAGPATQVVTTEKDLVRLEPLAPWPFDCQAVPLSLSLEGWDDLVALLTQAIARRREAA
jgi:tetraacyldisaccharide 4'-kinase